MSAATSSKFGGGSAMSVSNAGSKARGGATAPAGSINIMGKLGGGAAALVTDGNEDLGSTTWNQSLTHLRAIREKLGDRIGKSNKKKKKSKKRGGLKSQNTMRTAGGSEADDGVTSYYTKLSAEDNEAFAGILVDYCFTNFQQGNAPRDFKAPTPILKALGIEDYDRVDRLEKLIFTMREAIEDQRRTWKTSDLAGIERTLKHCVAREMNKIDERKDARTYARHRPATPSDDSDANRDLMEVRSSLYNQSASPSRSPSPNKRGAGSPDPGHAKHGSTAMRSLGTSSDAGGAGRLGGSGLNLVKIQTSAAPPTKSALKALEATGSKKD